MSSKFKQGLAARTAPSVCFPIRPGGPLDPAMLPPTLSASFYILAELEGEPLQLHITRCTLLQDPDTLVWRASSDVEDDSYFASLSYDPIDDELAIHYDAEWAHSYFAPPTWIYLRSTTSFPFYLALDRAYTESPTSTIWGYINV